MFVKLISPRFHLHADLECLDLIGTGGNALPDLLARTLKNALKALTRGAFAQPCRGRLNPSAHKDILQQPQVRLLVLHE